MIQNRLIALDAYACKNAEKRKLEQQWEQFITGKNANPAIRSYMYESWQRCLQYGINPLHNKTTINLGKDQIEEYLSTNQVFRMMEPLMKNLKNHSMDSGHLVTFCNPSGEIVYLDGDLPLLLKAEDMNFVIGSTWSESSSGTNAIGTAIATGTPIQVFAGEHFCQEVQKWTCSAAPIRDPATNDILGVIDLTGLWQVNHPHSLSVVISMAQTVEEQLRKQLEFERFTLLEHYFDAVAKNPNVPIIVLDRGCRVVKASPDLYVQGWISSSHGLVGAPFQSIPTVWGTHWEVEHRRGIWRFELIPCFEGGNMLGAIVKVSPPALISAKKRVKGELLFHVNRKSTELLHIANHAQVAAKLYFPSAIQGELFAEDQFNFSEDFCKSLFEHNPDAICAFDLQGSLLHANPAAAEIFGYGVEELRGMPLPSLVSPEFSEKWWWHFQKAAKGEPQEFEASFKHKQGHCVDVMVKNFPIYLEQNIIGVYGIAKDITKLKQVEKDWKSTKKRLEMAIKNPLDAIAVIDLDGYVTKVNRVFEKMFGWTKPEIIGKKLDILTHGIAQEITKKQKEFAASRVTTYETVLHRKDGSSLNVNIVISPILNDKGNVVAFAGIIRDITKHKQMEDALNESEKQLRTVINAMSDFIFFKDGDGRWIQANESGLRLFQLQDIPYQGKSAQELACYSDVFRNGLKKSEESENLAWEKGRAIRVEEVIQLPSGESRVFDVIKVPLFYDDGRRRGLVVIGRDITELKKTEELLRKSEKLSVVGQLAAGVAHEIRNPLTSLKGFLQFLQEGKCKEEYLHIMLAELDQIELIVNDFLELAKPQATKFELRDVSVLMHEVISQLHSQTVMKHVRIITNFHSNVPRITCEEKQLKQVFQNILTNAIEAMPEGGDIVIEAVRHQYDQVLIRIIDEGYGISEERLSKLGEPFYAIKEKGTGLGLMFCYKIIEAHQGNIQFKSEEGKGTTVEIILPGALS